MKKALRLLSFALALLVPLLPEGCRPDEIAVKTELTPEEADEAYTYQWALDTARVSNLLLVV